eukprot:gene9292-11802_t
MANSDVHALVKSGKVSADAAIEAVRLHGEAAGEYMQSTLNKGGKVTRGAVRGAGIPPKVAGTVTGAFGELFGKRTRGGVLEGLARWEASGMPKGQKIEVDAAALLALKEAHDALESITEKRSSRASERAAKASQGNLEGLEPAVPRSSPSRRVLLRLQAQALQACSADPEGGSVVMLGIVRHAFDRAGAENWSRCADQRDGAISGPPASSRIHSKPAVKCGRPQPRSSPWK